MLTPVRRICVMAVGLALLSACASEVLIAPAPVMAPDNTASMAKLGGLKKKVLLQLATGVARTTPLAENITVGALIGVAGGTLTIPAAGVTVIVPAGALTQPTEIVMTARKGALLAYDFKPHGLVFAKSLTFQQSLTGTNATGLSSLSLSLGYYTDPALLTATGGTVSEVIAGLTSLSTFTSSINHFSGYMVSSGRKLMTSPPPE